MQLFGSKKKTTEDQVKGVYMYGSVGRLVVIIIAIRQDLYQKSDRVVEWYSTTLKNPNMFIFDHYTTLG